MYFLPVCALTVLHNTRKQFNFNYAAQRCSRDLSRLTKKLGYICCPVITQFFRFLMFSFCNIGTTLYYILSILCGEFSKKSRPYLQVILCSCYCLLFFFNYYYYYEENSDQVTTTYDTAIIFKGTIGIITSCTRKYIKMYQVSVIPY